ncbi:hypothetical protein M885DRAFT_499977 [Pelagophyceae sp. CCMP2097]|nr:hypothetical protein M885DRAFT_499977 [Pelagophyceae sp. CCMP2097]
MADARPDRVSAVLAAAKTTVLSVGSGDGSQQAAIVRQGHLGLVSTFYDSKQNALAKYSSAKENLEYLDAKGIELHFSTDVAQLGTTALKGRKFDIILFYFPHAGGDTATASVLQANQSLVKDFLAAAVRVLAPKGEVQLAVKTGGAYDKWNVLDLFQAGGLRVTHELNVDKAQFPGYVHRLTKGTDGTVPDKGAKLYALEPLAGAAAAGGDAAGETTHTLLRLDARVLVFAVHEAALTDGQVAEKLLGAFGARPSQTVLDLRSSMLSDLDARLLPDTRQLNRVLYDLEALKRVKRGPPLKNGRNSKKPTWALVDANDAAAAAAAARGRIPTSPVQRLGRASEGSASAEHS